MKKLFMKLFKIQDVEIVLTKERNITNKKIAKLKKELNINKQEIKLLKSEISRIRTKVSEMGLFLHKTDLENYFVQHGHDPKGERCDICKGRELGILDYRKDLLGIASSFWRDALVLNRTERYGRFASYTKTQMDNWQRHA